MFLKSLTKFMVQAGKEKLVFRNYVVCLQPRDRDDFPFNFVVKTLSSVYFVLNVHELREIICNKWCFYNTSI